MTTGARRGGALEDERAFLLESLRDLERERAAGDVSEEDYARLRARYTARAAAVLRADAGPGAPGRGEATPGARSPRRLRVALGRPKTRRALSVSAALCLVVAVVLAALSLSGVRLPGEGETGSVVIPRATKVTEQLGLAANLADKHDFAPAIALYDEVLSEVPHQAEALTYRGWLERLAGLRSRSQATIAAGDASLAEAARIAPGYPDGRALYGIALAEDAHDRAGALREFRACLADHPPKALLADVGATMAGVFAAAGAAVPGALGSAGTGGPRGP